jgi:Fe-S-cluster containining protein
MTTPSKGALVTVSDGSMGAIRNPLPKPGRGLYGTRVLLQSISQQSNPQRAAEAVWHLIEGEVKSMRWQKSCDSSAEVAESMHLRIDKHVRQQDEKHPVEARAVQCTRGCTACCFQNVTVNEAEADRAYAAAFHAGHELDVERLRVQGATPDPDAYLRLPREVRRCVMLKDDGDCAIYEARPASCRVYRVVSPPEHCDTEKHPGHSTLAVIVPLAEVVISASMRVFRHGSFAALLLECIEGKR